MLDVFPGGMRLSLAPGAAKHEAHRHTRDRRVDPAVVHEGPDDQGERYVDVPATHPRAQQYVEHGEAEERAAERQEVDVLGEEDRDDEDGEQVVDDCEGQQEGTQRCGERRTDDREDGQCERDVGGGGHGPAGQGPVTQHRGDRVDDCGDGHAAECRRDGQGGSPGVAELPGDQLTFEFDPATKKNTASSPSAAQWDTERCSPRASGPKWKSLTEV